MRHCQRHGSAPGPRNFTLVELGSDDDTAKPEDKKAAAEETV
jgi:hypothetical protein